MFKVFLSSTSTDLAPYRAKVREKIEGLGQASVCMETFGARPETPLKTCRKEVEGADALIVIVGHRCGWVPGADEEGGDGETSITRLEVTWALDAGKPVFAFLVDPKAPWTGEREEARLLDAAASPDEVALAVRQLQAFRLFLEKHRFRELFSSEDDLAGKVVTGLARWLLEVRDTAGKATEAEDPPPLWTGSPFLGLRAFTPVDAPIFFGRERETDRLVERLAGSSCRFLLIFGASGSGKSSLVAAGLIPRLAANAIPGSEDWLLPQVPADVPGRPWVGLRFTPGEQGADPFQAVAAKLAPLLPDDRLPREVAQDLATDHELLRALVERALLDRPARAEALLFIDQFEELITVVSDDLRTRFIGALAAAAASPRIRVVGTVRSDFYHRCIDADARLADLLADRGATVPLGTPGPAALSRMIAGPAERAGLRFDNGLVDQLVDGTAAHPGGLALLAFALHELWTTRTDSGLLTDAAFQAFGGLAGVVKTRAEETFIQLSPAVSEERLVAVFGQLVSVDEQGAATRRRARRAEVVQTPDDGRLVDAFVRARLLVDGDAGDRDAVLEVAHEALLREWPRLVDWITTRTDDLRVVRYAETSALEWERQGQPLDLVWPQKRLVPVYDALDHLGRKRGSLPYLTRAFLRLEFEHLEADLAGPHTSRADRAAILDALDRLPDPRPGVGVRSDGTPDIVWCPIPAGRVTIKGSARSTWPPSTWRSTRSHAPNTMSSSPLPMAMPTGNIGRG